MHLKDISKLTLIGRGFWRLLECRGGWISQHLLDHPTTPWKTKKNFFVFLKAHNEFFGQCCTLLSVSVQVTQNYCIKGLEVWNLVNSSRTRCISTNVFSYKIKNQFLFVLSKHSKLKIFKIREITSESSLDQLWCRYTFKNHHFKKQAF